MKKLNVILLMILLGFISNADAQLIPDSSFSQNGYFITNHTQTSFTYKVHELDNGNILAIGVKNGKIHIWKFDAYGNPIVSFGSNGEATNTALNAEPGNVFSLYDYAVYENGKIMVMAELGLHNQANFDSSTYTIILASFNSDGSLNTTFNGTGYLLDHPDPNYEYEPHALVAEPNETENNTYFYVGSEAYEKGHTSCPIGFGRWCISKYGPTGSKDLSFNNVGYLQRSAQVLSTTTLQSPHARIRDMKLMANGSLKVVGALHNYDKAYFDVAIKPNGQFDSSFATNGISNHAVNFLVAHGGDLTNSKILEDNSVIFYSGHPYYAPGDSTVVNMVKNDALGNNVTSFGTAGVSNFKYFSAQYPRLLYKSDNTMLICYYKQYGSNQKIEFIKLNSNGLIDASFGNNGRLLTQPITNDVFINGSSVFAGTWNKNETSLFLAASKQPVSFHNYGIFKYKWPGLTPLSTTNIINAAHVTLYPNPVLPNNSILIKNIDASSSFSIYTLSGKTINAQKQIISSEHVSVTPNQRLAEGVYFLKIRTKEGQQITKTFLVK